MQTREAFLMLGVRHTLSAPLVREKKVNPANSKTYNPHGENQAKRGSLVTDTVKQTVYNTTRPPYPCSTTCIMYL